MPKLLSREETPVILETNCQALSKVLMKVQRHKFAQFQPVLGTYRFNAKFIVVTDFHWQRVQGIVLAVIGLTAQLIVIRQGLG